MKRALCVGINTYPVRGTSLKGCVNDAKAWAALLRDHFGFAADDVTLLLDAQATKASILAGFDALLAGARAGDILVFTNSSHGTYVLDEDGDETRYDEAICPYDMRDNLIVDDELRVRIQSLARGVHLTVISDSCFSGTVTRGAISAPDDRCRRFVSPRTLGRPEIRYQRNRAHPVRAERYPERQMKEVLVSGCRDSQSSYDARFGRTYHGAMTYFALDIIARAKYRLSYDSLWDELVVRLDREGFDQAPQVEGKAAAKNRLLFS